MPTIKDGLVQKNELAGKLNFGTQAGRDFFMRQICARAGQWTPRHPPSAFSCGQFLYPISLAKIIQDSDSECRSEKALC
jgi:hypothetical protein